MRQASQPTAVPDGVFPGRPFVRSRRRHRSGAAFTIVEALIAMVVLMIFALGSTVTLNLFDQRAAKNRNTEAARGIVDDYVNYLLNDNTPAPTVTSGSVANDNTGAPLGVVCTGIGTRNVPATLPLVVSRTASVSIVQGTLYWQVQAVGSVYGLSANTALLQVTMTLVYTYRTQNYYYQVITFKAAS